MAGSGGGSGMDVVVTDWPTMVQPAVSHAQNAAISSEITCFLIEANLLSILLRVKVNTAAASRRTVPDSPQEITTDIIADGDAQGRCLQRHGRMH